jgi:hypothetical protein
VPHNLMRLAVGLVAASLFACGGATSLTSTSPTATPHGGGSTSTPTATPGSGGAPTPGQIDPCTLLSQQAAASLAGASLAAGVSGSAGAVRTCGFNGSPAIVIVGLVQAADAATAQEYKSGAEAGVLPHATSHESLPTFADGADIIRLARAGITINSIYVVDGTNFFSIGCENVSPTDSALKFAATLVLGALP